MQQLDIVFAKWSSSASHLIGEVFDNAQPYLQGTIGSLDEKVRFVSNQLFIDCHLSSESVLLLVRAGKLWDADLINRAVTEGTVKYIYLLDGEPIERRKKAEEYWEVIPSFQSVKRSERAKAFLEDTEDSNATEWRPYRDLLLSDADMAERRKGTNKKERSNIEQRWSFSNIVQSYSKGSDPGLRMLAHLSYGYGMSSHLIHKDGDRVAMVWERYGRDEDRQNAIKIGHAARLVSDVCEFAKFRFMRLCLACGEKPTGLEDLVERYSRFQESLKEANELFNTVEYGNT